MPEIMYKGSQAVKRYLTIMTALFMMLFGMLLPLCIMRRG